MEKKNVAFLTISLGYGGAERVISRLAPEMSKYYNFYIILFDSTKNVYNCEANIISLGEGEINNRFLYAIDLIKKGRKLQKIIADKNIDCVVSFLPIPDIINLIFNNNAKRIINIRGDLNQDLVVDKISSRIKHLVKTKLYKKADGAIVLSEITKNQLINEYGVKSNICVIANPFNTDDIRLLSKESLSDEEMDVFEGDTIISVGRLNLLKGFKHLLLTEKELIKRGKNIRLIIIGEGEERHNLEKLIVDNDMATEVLLLGKKDNPFKYISKSKIYVTSSISEGFPNALVEAMACGIPAISTDCMTGPREILYDEANINSNADNIEYADYGVLVPCFSEIEEDANNVEKYSILADAIEKLLTDNALYESYKVKSLQRANDFSFNKCVEKYISYINGIVR